MNESEEPSETGAARMDRWLWAVRAFKTRALAAGACRAGSVTINGLAVKASRDVRVGDVVVVQDGLVERRWLVVGVPRSRVGAKLVALYGLDQTPPEVLAKAKEKPLEQWLAREKGTGRPTKKDRREIDRWLG